MSRAPRHAAAAAPAPVRAAKGGRPTREVAARLGEHILDTALREYVRDGIDRVSLDGIARAACVSKRTLYARFGDRYGLLLAAIERGVARVAETRAGEHLPGTLADQLLHLGIEMLHRSLLAETIGLERLIASIAQRDPHVHDRISDTVQSARLEPIRAILVQARDRGEIVEGRVDLAASILFDVLVTNPRRQAMLGRLDGGDAAAVRLYFSDAIDMVLHGMTLREATSGSTVGTRSN